MSEQLTQSEHVEQQKLKGRVYHRMVRDLAWLMPRVIIQDNGCWIWQGRKNNTGYGLTGKAIMTHRLAWSLRNGTIPGGMFICHSCDNPPCCNPDHLWLGTHAENMADCKAKGRYHLGEANGMRKHPERHASGENSGAAKLTLKQVEEIRRKHAEGLSRRALGEEFGVTSQAIGKIVLGKTWAIHKAPLTKQEYEEMGMADRIKSVPRKPWWWKCNACGATFSKTKASPPRICLYCRRKHAEFRPGDAPESSLCARFGGKWDDLS